ncbi:MAG TPA: serine/threonine-protein kinase [Gemmatimonadaceae bacterium]|nr:serine/threonine-protein kinase [Gemmatimonadaceae bacterium]
MTTLPHDIARLQRALGGRYTVERELGRGGMAVVYLAHDVRHARYVAVKVLRPEAVSLVDTARFLLEIRFTAALQHPHILPLFDSGEADGLLYLVTPYIADGTLRNRLDCERRLPVDDALALVRLVAEALHYAHECGVIHRDVKPENILLHNGSPLLADFGIAIAVAQADKERMTSTGLSVGTPQYMSPEQVAGERTIDSATDIYSLGAVAYELLVGEPPTTGPSAQAIAARVLAEQPRRIRTVRATVSQATEAAILKALAKDPLDRHRTAAAFATALTSTGTVSREPPELAPGMWFGRHRIRVIMLVVAAVLTFGAAWSWATRARRQQLDANVIAVMPFRVTAPDSSHNYLREGAIDVLAARLTGEGAPRAVDTRTLLVAWRGAVRDRRDLPEKESVALARRLGAGQVLLSGLVVTPDGSMLTAALIDVESGRTLMPHTDRTVGTELLLVERLARSILVRKAGEDASNSRALSDSTQAVKEYLAGLQALRGNRALRASDHFARAIRIDSTFALAALRMWEIIIIQGFWPDSRLSGTPDQVFSLAWSLRARLTDRDRRYLEALAGDRYLHKDLVGVVGAAEAASHAAPDAMVIWSWWGALLTYHGTSIGVVDWTERAAAVLDSAIVLDSTYGPALRDRLFIALARRDKREMELYAQLYFAIDSTGDDLDAVRWTVAVAAGNKSAIARQRARFDRFSDVSVAEMAPQAVVLGLGLADAGEAVTRRLAVTSLAPEWRLKHTGWLFEIRAVRGQVASALALVDSVAEPAARVDLARRTIRQALLNPKSGYDSAASRADRDLKSLPASLEDQETVCLTQLLRVSRGDTAGVRTAARRLRRLAFDRASTLFPRDERGDVCATLLEAMIEPVTESTTSTAVNRLDSLLRRGPGWDRTSYVANVLLARLQATRQDVGGALASTRRRAMALADYQMAIWPTALRMEGRLAASIGDTDAAIRAYSHYLTLRDAPDPGPMANEVADVRVHLARLGGYRQRASVPLRGLPTLRHDD